MDVGAERITFSFGRNWERYVDDSFDRDRARAAERHLLEFLELPDLAGKTFLDAGCGSGLHSLAAHEAGARRVVSFDIDPASVRATARLRGLARSTADWELMQGSVLDEAFLARLEPADIVYSWGVLHHTGRMWDAIRNVARFVKPDGLFYIGLYVTTPESGYWIDVKRRYNAASEAKKRLMEAWHIARYTVFPNVIRFRNPFGEVRNRGRGMAYMTDVRDWLGGHPYEDAPVADVVRFALRELGLVLRNLRYGSHFAEYLFERR